jgi:glutamate/tyrosine decarboxylase-like PLP-dependent enzyme
MNVGILETASVDNVKTLNGIAQKYQRIILQQLQ